MIIKRIFICSLFVLLSFIGFAQERFLETGSGGGFTGAITLYKIRPEGEVLSGKGIVDIKFTKRGKIRKSKAKRLCNKAQRLLNAYPGYNQPGNMYYFIAVTSNGKSTRLTWNDAAQDTPARAKKLYEKIMSSIMSITFSDI